jgi:putative nucleotidyltransferase with HDIG domain
MAGAIELSQALRYAKDLKAAYESTREREQALAAAYQRLQSAHQQALHYAEDLKQLYHRMQRAILQSLLGLANALEAKDPYTHGHSQRVAGLARRLALAVDVSDTLAKVVAQAGLLHDIGKIGIPESVLRKPGPLTDDEWVVMRRHPVVGAQIVAPLEFFSEGATIIRHHHERVDGCGYPDSLRADAIPLGARIVAVADVYDALTSDRPYRRRLSPREAIAQIEQWAGQTLEANLVSAFLTLVQHGRPNASL